MSSASRAVLYLAPAYGASCTAQWGQSLHMEWLAGGVHDDGLQAARRVRIRREAIGIYKGVQRVLQGVHGLFLYCLSFKIHCYEIKEAPFQICKL